ncbi:TPA: hypothetical protein ACH3X1_001169 [Trebouxia sp. C0004]
MAQGGTAAIYSVARLPEAAKWEISLNKRWEELLNPYLHGATHKPDLPWAASAEALLAVQQRCIDMRLYDEVVCLPRGIASVEFEKAFGYPGKVITSEYLLLAGPYGKYLLEDCFHPAVQAVVFEYLDLLGLMWEKTTMDSDLKKLESRLPIVLTMMEVLLPAWELDLNRHHMIHLVAAIRANGPC